MTLVAAIDCGTNTIKLLVAELDPATGTEHELLRTTRMVRLGQDVDRTGRLADEALARAFAACDEYAELLASYDVQAHRFCATSAARAASNADVFVDGVRQRLGMRVEVLTGSEEAALSYAGATLTLPAHEAPLVVVDIGGGSTELVAGDAHGHVSAGHSLDIGSVRMTERYLSSDPPTDDEVAAAMSAVDEALDTLATYHVDLDSVNTVVAVSGTGLTIAAGVLDLASLDGDALHHATISTRGVDEMVSTLLSMTVAERRTLPYMHPGRADVIAAGGIILERILERVPVDQLTVSVADILDGIAWSVA